MMQLPKKSLRIKTKVCWRKNLHFKPTEMLKLAYYDVGLSIFLRELLMKKSNDTFKRLRAVMKDVNGDHRQIIKTMQDQIDYLIITTSVRTLPLAVK